MHRPVSTLLLVTVLLALTAGPAAAQAYSFEVPQQVVDVYVEPDGTLRLVYAITFANNPGAAAIDFVDVGLPTDEVSLADVRAWIDGQPVTAIEASPYVDPGVAIGLGSRSIPAGGRGTVVVEISGVGGALFAGDQAGSASLKFSPSWFDAQFVTGSTDLTVTFHLPPGIASDAPRWHLPEGGWPSTDPAVGLDREGRIVYSWRATSVNAYTQYVFGASFPAASVPGATLRTPGSDFLSGLLGLVAGMAGCSFPLIPILIFIGLVIVAQNRSRLAYLPPRISVEGHGIKRGLTAVEAAVLLQTGLDKVLTMILFGVVRKGAARVVQEDPLQVEPLAADPADLRAYEKSFLAAIAQEKPAARRKALSRMMIDLVRAVETKMKGFSLGETRDYYRSIMRKAWAEVEAAGTPQVRSDRYTEGLEWLMLDRDFDGRTRRTLSADRVHLPIWWGNYRPQSTSGIGRVAAAPAPVARASPATARGAPASLPHLPGADFAASIARGVQTGAAGLVGDIGNFTHSVTQTTNPPTTRSYGGGSGGCACACACAGCACACAGGGR